jgi:hypothetical protein
MRENCSATIKKRRKKRTLFGKAGVTPKEGNEALRFIDTKISSSSRKVDSIRLSDSKNDLSSPAIGNPLKTSIPKTASNNARQCYNSKHRSPVSLWDIIGLFFVAQKGAEKQINIMFTSI